MSESITPQPSTIEYYSPADVYIPPRPKERYWLHAILLLATLFTTLVFGVRMQVNFIHNLPAFSLDDNTLSYFPLSWILAQPSRLLLGLPFAGTLMLILLAHEMGHYLYCRYYRVSATLPFFIPAPTLIGTLGAFIRIRSPIRSRKELFDIGIAGPIAGFVVAVVVLAVALGLSKPMPGGVPQSDIELGYPLIFTLMHYALAGVGVTHGLASLPFGKVLLHPIAIAAWVGMFATALNLLPGGQLDGGHIIFALFPRGHRIVSSATIATLIVMGYYFSTTWMIWAVLLRITGMRHPVVSDWSGVSRARRWLALFALLMLLLTFIPAPFLHTSLREELPLNRLTRHQESSQEPGTFITGSDSRLAPHFNLWLKSLDNFRNKKSIPQLSILYGRNELLNRWPDRRKRNEEYFVLVTESAHRRTELYPAAQVHGRWCFPVGRNSEICLHQPGDRALY